MARRYSEHESLESDITEIRDFIARDEPNAAAAVIEAIYRTLEAIWENPERFPRFISMTTEDAEIRRATVLPFRRLSIFFELSPNEIRILYVHHSSRDLRGRIQSEQRL